MKYTHILLDADDTLFDFKKAERLAVSEVIKLYGYEPDEERIALYHSVNDRWWKRFEHGEVSIAQLAPGRFIEFAREAGFKGDMRRMGEDYTKLLIEKSELLDGARELVEQLYFMGLTLCITTNGISSVQRPRFEKSPIKRYISEIFISEEMGVQKPTREYFERVRAELGGIPANRMIVLGDSLRSDIAGGINAGIDTAWFNPSGEPAMGVEPDYAVSNYDEFIAIIKQS